MQEHLVLQSQKEQRRLHSWPTLWGSRWRSQGQRYSPSPQKTLIMGRQLQQKWIISSSFDSQKCKLKSKKSSAPPLPPTQPPKTLSNSPPLLWPLLRGELTLTSFHPRNSPVWAIIGKPLNMSAMMFTITPPFSDMYCWCAVKTRDGEMIRIVPTNLLLTSGRCRSGWFQ